MPILAPIRYLAVVNSMIGHWQQINLALDHIAAPELKLKGGYSIANFIEARDVLTLALTAVQSAINTREDAMALRDKKKEALRIRMASVRTAINYQLQGTQYVRGMPVTPTNNAGEGVFLRAFDALMARWTTINALTGIANFTAPLLTSDGYDIAAFQADIADMRAAYLRVRTANESAGVAIRARDETWNLLYAKILEFRLAVKAQFPPNHPLVTTFPKITPTDLHKLPMSPYFSRRPAADGGILLCMG